MREAAEVLSTVVLAHYRSAPALVLCLSLLLAMPVLVLMGGVLRSLVARRPVANRASGGPCPSWPTEAWLEIGAAAECPRVSIGNGLVRIGRERDNEVCLAEDSVHRYHAAIHRTSDAEVLLTDLSNAEGNGISVNGRRVAGARLVDGDRIGLGAASLVFHSAPVAAAVLGGRWRAAPPSAP